MTQRPLHPEPGRKNAQPLQNRQHFSESAEGLHASQTSEEGFILRSRFHSVEDKRSPASKQLDDSLLESQKSLKKVRSSEEISDTDSSAQDLFRRMNDLVAASQTKVLGLGGKKPDGEWRGRVMEEFRTLNDGLWNLLFRFKLKSDVPSHLKEWMRKIVRLEDEKRQMQQQHEETVEALSHQLQSRTRDLQGELAKYQQGNLSLEEQVRSLTTQLTRTQETKELRNKLIKRNEADRSLRSSSRDLSLNSSNSSLEIRHSRKSSGSLFGDHKILPMKEMTRKKESDSRSISPAQRAIHALKVDLQKCKLQLEACQKERDVLRAWKDNCLKREQLADPHQAENFELERKKLTSKALILQHKLNSVIIAAQRFVRISSTLGKCIRDRDLISQFENSRAEIEVIIRENQGEGKGTGHSSIRNSPVRNSHSGESEQRASVLEKENARLEKELKVEQKRSEAFAEALDLTHRQVEQISGQSLNPVVFLKQQDSELKAARAQAASLSKQCGSLQEQLNQEKATNRDLRKRQETVQKSVQGAVLSSTARLEELFATASDFLSQRLARVVEKVEEKDKSLTKLKDAVLNRLQEQLKSLIQVNEVLSRTSRSDSEQTVERLQEEKASLESLLTVSQEWAEGKVRELQELLDQANAALAESQAQMLQSQVSSSDFAALKAKCEHIEQLEKQLLDMRSENEVLAAQVRSKSALLSQKEIELAEALYEKQRFEDSNKELLETEKQRSEDWIVAQETFQRELAEAYRKLEEATIEKQEAAKALAAMSSLDSPQVDRGSEVEKLHSRIDTLVKEIESLQEENKRVKELASEHENVLEELERTKSKIMEDLDSERVKVAGLNRELVATSAHVHEGKRKQEQLFADIESRKKENQAAWKAMEQLKVRLEKSSYDREEAIRSLTQELLEQQRKFQVLKEENLALVKSSSDASDTIHRLQQEVEAAKKEDSRASKSPAKFSLEQVQVRTEAPSTAETQLRETQVALEKCRKDLDKETQKYQELVAASEESNRQHEEDIQILRNALVSDHKSMCAQYEETIELLKQQGTAQREQFEEDLIQMQAECTQSEKRCKDLEVEAAALRADALALKSQYQEEHARAGRLESERQNLVEELALEVTAKERTISDLANLNALFLEKQAACESLSQELAESQNSELQLQAQVDELTNEVEDLKEEIRKLNSGDAPGSFGELNSPIQKESDEVKHSEGDYDFDFGASGKRDESDNALMLDSEPTPVQADEDTPRGALLRRLQEKLQPYSAPQDDLGETVDKLLDELETVKKTKGGVVVPKLQFRAVTSSKESQTSQRAEDSKRSGSSGQKPQSAAQSVDQDTPRQKTLPELMKSRANQAKTEEIYALHNRIKALESELQEEQKFHEFSDMKIKMLKEEMAQRERQQPRGASGGPGIDEHLKGIVTKLVSLVPKQYPPHRNSKGETLVTTMYSMLSLEQSEVQVIEEARKSGKKSRFGLF